MSNENAGQVLYQIQDQLRSAGLRPQESGLLAFQLLVWSHLSRSERLNPNDTVDAALQYGATGIIDTCNRLAKSEGVLAEAFGDASRLSQFSGEYIVPALISAKRFVEGGIFERFSAVEISAELLQLSMDSLPMPPELIELMIRLTIGIEQKTVYCPWEASGELLGALTNKDVKLYVETPLRSPSRALLSLFREAPTTLAISDPLRSPSAVKGGHLEVFDATLSFPPLGLQLEEDVPSQDIYGRFPIRNATAIGLMLQHILAQTAGSAAVIVPNSFLFGLGKDRDLREYLLKEGCVEAVIGLPTGIYETSGISTALLLLDNAVEHRDVKFIDASQPHFRKMAGKARVALTNIDQICDFIFCRLQADNDIADQPLDRSLVVEMSVDEVVRNDSSLQVGRYVMAADQRNLQARMEVMPTVSLESRAEFLNPLPNKDRNSAHPDAIEVLEVGAVDLPVAGYIDTPKKKICVQLTSRRSGAAEAAFLHPGDVLLITKGSVGKVGIVPDGVPPPGPGGWIAGQSAIVLRDSKERDLRGLGLWLRSEMGQQLISGIASGAAIPMISIQTLRRLQVPILSQETVQRAVQVLDREAVIQRDIESMKVEQSTLSKYLWNEIFELTPGSSE